MNRVVGWTGRIVVGLLVVFLLAPMALVAVMSFSSDAYLAFPPDHWGSRQYSTLFGSREWTADALRSAGIALAATVISVLAAALLVLGLGRTGLRAKNAIVAFCTLPMLVPGVALAMALYGFLAKINVLDTFAGVILSHAALCLPFALFVLWPAMQATSPDLELAAMTLGARRGRAWWDTTIRALARTLLAATIIAFVTSFDESTLVVFVGGPATMTLPLAIFNSVSTGVDPVITAIATLLIVGTAVLMSAAEALGAKERTR
ncbi:ABC transporter permease subunit [Nocardia panacis]|uniref:ABC transporter permease subunit n=1 Tax=Nocardia panacis TaxID=2340916 RepID=A0A3A4K2Y2_9NOCA|nr:ABC transporter permease subunit [Nocardia panacis]RJO70824.1 ABC transporter permease subunit [Nocardia panacis]